MESSNPVLTRFANKHFTAHNVATFEGVMHKSLLLLFITFVVASITWNSLSVGLLPATVLVPIFIVSIILGFGIVITLMFKPEWATWAAPVYGVVEGVFLGALSLIFERIYPGIVVQALLLTFGVGFIMLTLYRTKIIVVTEKLRTVIVIATLSIMAVYAVTVILSLFSVSVPYIHESGTIGIIFSLVVVTVAALNLLLDFDLIEKTVQKRMPKFMEWFCGFALLVTIVWLYIEILRLLAKLRDN